MTTYTALTDAVGGSLALSALVGTLPLITFFVMLLAVKARAHVSGLTALAVALAVAVLAFGMPWNLALLSATAPEQEGQTFWAESAREVLEGEAQLHRDWLGGNDITVTTPSPVTLGYTNFLVASCAVEPYVVGVAAVLPCFWLYAEIGMELARSNSPGHPYHAWLSTYGGEDFNAGARLAIEHTERALAAASPAQREQAMTAYLHACVYEREFFAQADRAW